MIKLPKNPTRSEKKEFRKLLSTPGTKFNIEGKTYAGKPAVFTVSDGYIEMGIYIMNVGYTGDTKIDLYTYDMFRNKTTATIRFADVTILSSTRPMPADMLVGAAREAAKKSGVLNFDGDGVYC